MALTLTPSGPSSLAATRVAPTSPALEDTYADWPGLDPYAARLEMLTIAPVTLSGRRLSPATQCLANRLMAAIAAIRFTSMTLRTRSNDMWTSGSEAPMPAQLTSAVGVAASRVTSSKDHSRSPVDVMSAPSSNPGNPWSVREATTSGRSSPATVQPPARNASQIALPMPPSAPVTMTTRASPAPVDGPSPPGTITFTPAHPRIRSGGARCRRGSCGASPRASRD